MKNPFQDHVVGIPVSSVSYTVEESAGKTTLSETATSYFLSTPSKECPISKQNRVDTLKEWINKLGKKSDDFMHGVREHVRLGPKVSATVKGKSRLGSKILQEGGMEKLFKQIFNVRVGEKLSNASQCYLSTTAGPIAGLLFISTERIAFYSERSLKCTLATGELIRTHYKVMIPLKKIKGANQSENMKKPTQKYIQVSIDDAKWKTILISKKQEIQLECLTVKQTKSCPAISPVSFKTTDDRNSSCPDYFRWIHEDLRPWKIKGITKEMVERAKSGADFRLVIVKGRVYIEQYRKSFQTRDLFTWWGILQLLRKYPGRLPDLDLMFHCDDWPVIRVSDYQQPKAIAPPRLFQYCGNDWSLGMVFPDWSF
ncbi:hypothetical protein NE237_006476 [Protea cynaroides]|uniref:GRAM domain-containing protein n=1 Tax=Protea cynaroides TaxID=273540 RepID=A0A9Q0QVH3_9MAGN|nr:hypothetical protein NE237_006476 [Protea cynaroides]